MKFKSILVIFVVFCIVTSLTKGFRFKSLQTAFVNITKVLAKQNHVVTIAVDNYFGNESDSVPFASTAGIPHIVTKIGLELGNFTINSSAIVSLESIQLLNEFHNHSILPVTFSI